MNINPGQKTNNDFIDEIKRKSMTAKIFISEVSEKISELSCGKIPPQEIATAITRRTKLMMSDKPRGSYPDVAVEAVKWYMGKIPTLEQKIDFSIIKEEAK